MCLDRCLRKLFICSLFIPILQRLFVLDPSQSLPLGLIAVFGDYFGNHGSKLTHRYLKGIAINKKKWKQKNLVLTLRGLLGVYVSVFFLVLAVFYPLNVLTVQSWKCWSRHSRHSAWRPLPKSAPKLTTKAIDDIIIITWNILTQDFQLWASWEGGQKQPSPRYGRPACNPARP